jgi:Leucine-rich repeat (LRR) protein
LVKLKTLDLSFNNIKRLTPRLKELGELSIFDLSNNKIEIIADYSFERIGKPVKINIDLRQNKAISFENKVIF